MVIPPPQHCNALGFYFDPQTTYAAEVTIEAIQTTVDQIRANPVEFAKNPLGSWVIPARLVRTAPGR